MKRFALAVFAALAVLSGMSAAHADNWNGPNGVTPAAVLECKTTGLSALPCGTTGNPVAVSIPGGVSVAPPASQSTTANAPVTVTTSATAVFALDVTVVHRAINNSSGTQTVYWGKTAGVTTSNGDPIPAGYTMNFDGYVGPVYAIVASGSATPGKVEW